MHAVLTEKFALRIAAVALLWLTGTTASAHSDMDKPLFVAASGIDEGRCLDPQAPCRSISYALSRVGKGGQIRVARGEYGIADVADLFHIVSGLVSIQGGYDASDGFQQPGPHATTLTGVPAQYRAVLASRGFHIVADRKGIDADKVEHTGKLLAQHKRMQAPLKVAPCTNGQVDGLSCQNTELLSHVPFASVSARPGAAADVWGFVDLNTRREYAIVGYNIGTAVFDVSDAENPREVGFVDGQNTTWRDIKVHQFYDPADKRWKAYAYVTTDGSSDGLFVIDLTDLPHRISRQSYASDFSAAHNVYAANTDFATGLSRTGTPPVLVIAGSNNGGGRFRLYDLSIPSAPLFTTIPSSGGNDYMHDAASMIIYDDRKDTQCVNAIDYCEVLFDFNESTVDIWDITDVANPVRLSRTPYGNSAYTHSGWPSEDGMYLFVHDELDEQNFGLQTTLRTFSLANLAAPSLAADWSGPTTAIDHNGFVRGNRYYMSNYSRGLTVLDISDPTAPQTAGWLDTYPFSDNANFVGAWGAYPYFHSGNVAISDISSGLYMVGDETLESPAGRLSFVQESAAASEGSMISVEVQRIGGSSGAVSVALTVIPATAGSADLDAMQTTLNWADGEANNKTATFAAVADTDSEGLEFALVRLEAPAGGASIEPASVASVFVSDPGGLTSLEFATPTVSAAERGFGHAVVVVQRKGNATGAASVDFAVTAGDATQGSDYTGTASGTLDWVDGDALPKVLEFELDDDGISEGDEFFELTLSAPVGGTIGTQSSLRVTILDGAGTNQAPNAVAGSSQTVAPGATVILNGNASNDPDGDSLSYAWTQTTGPTVTLSNADSANATFTAPDVSSDTLLRFSLQVSDPGGLSDTSIANVTVSTDSNSGFGGGGGGATTWLLLLGALGLSRRRPTRTGAA